MPRPPGARLRRMSTTVRLYHNPRCSKSRATLALLEERGCAVEVVEYLKTPPSARELGELVAKLGIAPADLVRKKEAEFQEHFAGRELSDAEWLEALATYPKLIERPIAVVGEAARIGRPPEDVLELI